MQPHCRTCMQPLTEVYKPICLDEEMYKHKLLYCVPDMNIHVLPNARMCNSCYKALDVTYQFKTRCREAENKINDYFKRRDFVKPLQSSIKCRQSESTLEDVIVKQEPDIDDFDSVCRACLQQITKDCFVFLKEEYCERKLTYCVPEVDLRTISDVKICEQCYAALNVAYKFKLKCQEVEESINSNYLNKYGTLNNRNLLRFARVIVKNEIDDERNESKNATSQQESTTCWNGNDADLIGRLREKLHEKFNSFFYNFDKSKFTKPINLFNLTESPYKYRSNRNVLYTDAFDRLFQCTHCNYTASSARDIKLHVYSHNNINVFKCSKCSYISLVRKHYDEHILKHSLETTFQCTKCDFETSHRCFLNNHLHVHAEKQLLECLHCEYKTPQKSELAEHLNTCRKLFECSQCEYKTLNESYLEQHKVLHGGCKLFACAKCNYKTSYILHLYKHVRKHIVKRRYKCFKCEYRTTCKSILWKHLLVHPSLLCKRASYKYNKHLNTRSLVLKI